MNHLPSHWSLQKLSNIADTSSGGTPSRKRKDYYNGNIPWVKSGELNDGFVREVSEFITDEAVKNSSAKIFPKGTLLIAMYGATIGKLGILEMDAATNQAICAIFPKVENSLNKKYLMHYLKLNKSKLISQGIGGAQPNINQGIIRNLVIPLPPIDEQKQIVDKIEELFSVSDNIHKSLDNAPTQLVFYKHSILKSIFFSGNHKEVRRLGDCFEILSGGTPSTKVETYWDGNIPWITSASIHDDKINFDKKVTTEGIKHSATHIVPRGSILVVTRVGLGKIAVAPIDMCFSQDIQALLPSPEYEESFLLYFLSYIAQGFKHKSRGTTISGITKKQLQDTLIPVLDKDEQKRIIELIESQFSVVSANWDNLTQINNKLSVLKQSILNKAFSGKLVN